MCNSTHQSKNVNGGIRKEIQKFPLCTSFNLNLVLHEVSTHILDPGVPKSNNGV